MSEPLATTRWQLADWAMAAVAVAPHDLGGVLLHSAPGPVRDLWLEGLRENMVHRPVRKAPLHITENRLIGGLDLGATLQSGRLQREQGLLQQSDGGIVILAMAERAERRVVAHLCAALDRGALDTDSAQSEGLAPARIGVVACDEGIDDEVPAVALIERLAMRLDLNGIALADIAPSDFTTEDIERARQEWHRLSISDDHIGMLAATSVALGVDSPRAMILTTRLAQVFAALDDAASVMPPHLELASILGLAHRATRLPTNREEETPAEPNEPQSAESSEPPPPENTDDTHSRSDEKPPEETLTEAVESAIPRGLLELLRSGVSARQRGASGKAGANQRHHRRGRPVGTAPGDLSRGERLNLIATLRAATPWQRLRASDQPAAGGRPLSIRKQDFRVTRFRHPQQSATVFVVDASGSAAMHRMAEAKGAVELLLADCYVRRDTVALIAFRGTQAELLLPPTRSLVRAKRALQALPAGGGTPLASAIDMTRQLAGQLQRQGATATAVFITDGVANIARDGTQGRGPAGEDAAAAAQGFRCDGIRSLLIDSSPRAQPRARELAGQLGSQYLVMPYANASGLRDAVTIANRGVA